MMTQAFRLLPFNFANIRVVFLLPSKLIEEMDCREQIPLKKNLYYLKYDIYPLLIARDRITHHLCSHSNWQAFN